MEEKDYLETIFSDIQELFYFRDLFRNARAIAQKNSESCNEILFSLEKLGLFLVNKSVQLEIRKREDLEKFGKLNLGEYYKEEIGKIAKKSPLAEEILNQNQAQLYHTNFDILYDSVKDGRNDAMHQGAYARHLTDHAVQVALIIEDALMTGKDKVSDYMVRNVLQASLWQPLSFVRQQMLSNSFSYIPFLNENNEWSFLSDRDVAKYINQDNKKSRKINLSKTVKQAINDSSNNLNFNTAMSCKHDIKIEDALKLMEGKPLIFTETNDNNTNKIIGIVTAFDLL